ncbi:hypothetical protein [Micromonospora sp. 15K316]|nr:hypothetical protein [Micromonospora sp. 15K316]
MRILGRTVRQQFGRSYRVVPLVELDVTDPRTAALLHRYREGQLRPG